MTQHCPANYSVNFFFNSPLYEAREKKICWNFSVGIGFCGETELWFGDLLRMSKIVSLKRAFFDRFIDYKNVSRVFAKPVTLDILRGENWAVVGDSKLDFMQVLAGKYMASPAGSRTYPALLKESWPTSVIELLQFTNNSYGKAADGVGNGGFTHLGARYETFKDLEIDINTRDFICDLSYNSSHAVDKERFEKLLDLLLLRGLDDKFINGLSNGQFRRARIAKALYKQTKLLLFDDPFLGLDPTLTLTVSQVLKDYSHERSIVLGLRVQDPIPDWVDHVAIVDSEGLVSKGTRAEVQLKLDELLAEHHAEQKRKKLVLEQRQLQALDKFEQRQKSNKSRHEIMIEFDHVNVQYNEKAIIKDLNWKVYHGEKWHIRGNNGTGKTTILALIMMDHPQSWNSNISLFNVRRKAGKTNYFDNNADIGFTSPELHALFPRNRTVFETIGNGFDVGNYLPPTNLSSEQNSAIMRLIKGANLDKDTKFKDLSISDQKVVLFLRAIVKTPKILILDEAFSAMTDDAIEDCKQIVDNWTHGCILVVGHVDSEIPKCDKYLRLVDPLASEYETGIVV